MSRSTPVVTTPGNTEDDGEPGLVRASAKFRHRRVVERAQLCPKHQPVMVEYVSCGLHELGVIGSALIHAIDPVVVATRQRDRAERGGYGSNCCDHV